MKIRWLKIPFNAELHWKYGHLGIVPYQNCRYYLVLQIWNNEQSKWENIPIENIPPAELQRGKD